MSYSTLGLVTSALALLLASHAAAAPSVSGISAKPKGSITPLTQATISAFKPFTHFASAAYCNPAETATWKCGTHCDANSDFIPVASGGDGAAVQFWYVGYSPSQATVIVAHQGTDNTKVEALQTDADFNMSYLNHTLFPRVGNFVHVHKGFAKEQARTAHEVAQAVRSAIAAHKAKKVTIVGHSLGGALALLDGLYLFQHIAKIQFRVIGYGMPRVGNQYFADYVDKHLPQLTRINNREDLVPIIPGIFQGYHHPSGEVHITDDSQWLSCPGQDNPSKLCTTGDVDTINDGNTRDHSGPYDGIYMGC